VFDYGLDDQVIRVWSPTEAKDFSCSCCFQTGSGIHSASCVIGTRGLFLRVKHGWGLMLITYPHLVPRSRMSRSYTSSPPKHFHGVWWYYFTLPYLTLPLLLPLPLPLPPPLPLPLPLPLPYLTLPYFTLLYFTVPWVCDFFRLQFASLFDDDVKYDIPVCRKYTKLIMVEWLTLLLCILGPGFKSWPNDWLFWWRLFVVFLSPSRRILG
jgi:hypothetical protein